MRGLKCSGHRPAAGVEREAGQRHGDLLDCLLVSGAAAGRHAALRDGETRDRRLPGGAAGSAEADVRRRDDRGSSLLLVLIVVTVVGLGLSALLSRSDSAQRVSQTLDQQTAASYAADGAMEAAINNLRNSTYNGESGQRCFGLTDTLSLVLYN